MFNFSVSDSGSKRDLCVRLYVCLHVKREERKERNSKPTKALKCPSLLKNLLLVSTEFVLLFFFLQRCFSVARSPGPEGRGPFLPFPRPWQRLTSTALRADASCRLQTTPVSCGLWNNGSQQGIFSRKSGVVRAWRTLGSPVRQSSSTAGEMVFLGVCKSRGTAGRGDPGAARGERCSTGGV